MTIQANLFQITAKMDNLKASTAQIVDGMSKISSDSDTINLTLTLKPASDTILKILYIINNYI